MLFLLANLEWEIGLCINLFVMLAILYCLLYTFDPHTNNINNFYYIIFRPGVTVFVNPGRILVLLINYKSNIPLQEIILWALVPHQLHRGV